jgi:hypothetical protein
MAKTSLQLRDSAEDPARPIMLRPRDRALSGLAPSIQAPDGYRI